MKSFVDNKVLQAIEEKEVLIEDGILFGWPSLLEYLGLSNLFDNLPPFDQSNLYSQIMSALDSELPIEQITSLYDQLFAELLTQIQDLPETQPGFLQEAIQKKPSKVFSEPLAQYESAFKEYPEEVLHDFILYLGWDRVCVACAILFEQSSSTPKIRRSLDVLKSCLVESFQHITEDGKTVPGFFRLMEAFYAYQMREDNLQSHTDVEWQILCQGAKALKAREVLPDVYTIDAAIISSGQMAHELKVYTARSEEQVNFGRSLAMHMMKSIKKEFSEWRYTLATIETAFVTLAK